MKLLRHTHIRGFTLIEAMITVAIIAILAAIALPSYTESVRRARRSDAKDALNAAAMQAERYFTQNLTYVGLTAGTHFSATSPQSFYTISIGLPIPTANTYALTATRAGVQTSDTTCGDYTLDQAHNVTVSIGTVATCWNR